MIPFFINSTYFSQVWVSWKSHHSPLSLSSTSATWRLFYFQPEAGEMCRTHYYCPTSWGCFIANTDPWPVVGKRLWFFFVLSPVQAGGQGSLPPWRWAAYRAPLKGNLAIRSPALLGVYWVLFQHNTTVGQAWPDLSAHTSTGQTSYRRPRSTAYACERDLAIRVVLVQQTWTMNLNHWAGSKDSSSGWTCIWCPRPRLGTSFQLPKYEASQSLNYLDKDEPQWRYPCFFREAICFKVSPIFFYLPACKQWWHIFLQSLSSLCQPLMEMTSEHHPQGKHGHQDTSCRDWVYRMVQTFRRNDQSCLGGHVL